MTDSISYMRSVTIPVSPDNTVALMVAFSLGHIADQLDEIAGDLSMRKTLSEGFRKQAEAIREAVREEGGKIV